MNARRRQGNPALISVETGHREGRHGRPVSEGTRAAFVSFKRGLDRRLQAEGVHGLKPRNLGGRHVDKVIRQVVGEVERGERTIASGKNWMSHLRAYTRAIGKAHLVPRTNAEVGLGRRDYVPRESKAVVLTAGHLDRITCPYVRMSLVLQKEFGWRRETAIKVIVAVADKGDRVEIQGSWTKTGKAFTSVVRTPGQRAALDHAAELGRTTERGSLVPTQTYIQQVKRFEYQCKKAGLDGSHGLRHEYAQERYKQLTGFDCPLRGGPLKSEMTAAQRRADYEARKTISAELTHERMSIVVVYLGSNMRRGGEDG